ncbi:hypothetical protein M8818_005032 [Zalaria obscura]|uniref:Uncharacterized protein n=1 Tax=Zalaria obscura TaxID=2024903 RepID=A0ACC3SAU4_9PEZI
MNSDRVDDSDSGAIPLLERRSQPDETPDEASDDRLGSQLGRPDYTDADASSANDFVSIQDWRPESNVPSEQESEATLRNSPSRPPKIPTGSLRATTPTAPDTEVRPDTNDALSRSESEEDANDAMPRPASEEVAKQKPSFLRTWWSELACCIILVGALLAIVATMYPFQGQTLPSWPYNISINALLSIYTLIFKAALAYVLSQGLTHDLRHPYAELMTALGLGRLKWASVKRARPLSDVDSYDNASRGSIQGAIRLMWQLRLKFVCAIPPRPS